MPTKTPPLPPQGALPPVPLGDYTIREDGETLVNRLYYALPAWEGGQFRCAFFYEENIFRKEANGDLTLLHSEKHAGE